MIYDVKIGLKVQHIYQDLDLLDNGHFKENDSVPGVPSYHTLAMRMRENLDYIVKKLEEENTH